MGMASLITALLFGLAGVVAIYILLAPMLRSLLSALKLPALPGWPNVFHLVVKQKIKKRQSQLEEVETLSRSHSFSQLRPQIRSLFSFTTYKSWPLNEKIGEHHLKVLEFLIAQGRLHQVPLSRVPRLEELMHERLVLQRSLLESKKTAAKVPNLRWGKKAKSQNWAREEFKKKLEQLTTKLTANTGELQQELSLFFDDLETKSSDTRAIIH